MKQTGIIRKLDELGRIVIPKEIRDLFNIVEKDPIEIFIENNNIILKKYQPSCIFCFSQERLCSYNNKFICLECAKKINELSN